VVRIEPRRFNTNQNPTFDTILRQFYQSPVLKMYLLTNHLNLNFRVFTAMCDQIVGLLDSNIVK
jgi:hypothetical protein